LTDVDTEISRLGRYYAMHKETLQKMATFIDLCDLAQDLKERMQDPKRLFKNRGKAMVQEEQDRKKVNSIPRKKQELLALAEHKGNLIVFDESLSTMVEDYAQLYEELFPPPPTRSKTQQSNSNSLSSTRSGKSFSTTNSLRSNKTASPRSTKKLGRYHTSPAARRNISRVTPLSAQQSSSGRPNRMTGTSPLAKPNRRMTRANTTLGTSRSNTNVSRRVQMPAPSIHVNDGTINESVFSNNVPYNSTVCNDTSISSSMVPDITMDDMENTVVLSGLINRLVAARDAAVMQDKTLTQNTEVFSNERQIPRNQPVLSKIPRQASGAQLPAKNARKMRRSNSCSEIVMINRRQGEQRRRLGSRVEDQENLPSIRESAAVGRPSMVRSNSCLTASGTKRGQVVGGRLSRAGSSTNLVLR